MLRTPWMEAYSALQGCRASLPFLQPGATEQVSQQTCGRKEPRRPYSCPMLCLQQEDKPEAARLEGCISGGI